MSLALLEVRVGTSLYLLGLNKSASPERTGVQFGEVP